MESGTGDFTAKTTTAKTENCPAENLLPAFYGGRLSRLPIHSHQVSIHSLPTPQSPPRRPVFILHRNANNNLLCTFLF